MPITIIGEFQSLEPERIICLICGEIVDEKPIETDCKAVCRKCIENVYERPSERWINDIKSKIESEYEERWKKKLGLERTHKPRPRRDRKFEKGW